MLRIFSQASPVAEVLIDECWNWWYFLVYTRCAFLPFWLLHGSVRVSMLRQGSWTLGNTSSWAIGASAALLLSTYLMKGGLPRANSFPACPLLVFSLPLFASALVTFLQGWGDVALLQAIIGQFGTTGAYYLVVTSVSFLSILWTPTAEHSTLRYPPATLAKDQQGYRRSLESQCVSSTLQSSPPAPPWR